MLRRSSTALPGTRSTSPLWSGYCSAPGSGSRWREARELANGELQAVEHNLVGSLRPTLRDQPEGAAAFRAFILPDVMPVSGWLNADQRSFDVAADADWCSHGDRLSRD